MLIQSISKFFNENSNINYYLNFVGIFFIKYLLIIIKIFQFVIITN